MFEQDEIEKEVNLFVLDDGSPEADESVFVYLTEPTGKYMYITRCMNCS